VIAAPHVAAVDTASGGGVSAHALLVDGSPMMISEYAANCAVLMPSHCDGDTTVTESPDGTARASTLDDPPATLDDKIKTDCPDAPATAGRATAATTDPAPATPAATTTGTGTSTCAAATTTGAMLTATARRAKRTTILSLRRATGPSRPARLRT